MERHRERLVSRMLEKGIAPDFAEAVFNQIRGFGEYGFPESHAASFALIAYATAWLKCHYPVEFAAGLLNALPMGFYAPSTIIEDARRHGVEVRPVDVLHSGWDCGLERLSGVGERFAIRMGLRFVKGLAREDGRRVEAVAGSEAFGSLVAFIRETGLGARPLRLLAECGALDGFGIERRQALWTIDGLAGTRDSLPLDGHALGSSGRPAYGAPGSGAPGPRGPGDPSLQHQSLGQQPFEQQPLGQQASRRPGARPGDTGHTPGASSGSAPGSSGPSSGSAPGSSGDLSDLPLFRALSPAEIIAWDYRGSAHSTRGHPLEPLRPALSARGLVDARTLLTLPPRRQPVEVAGLVICRQRPPTAGGVMFLTLEDETGFLNVIVWPPVQEQHRVLVKTASFLAVRGTVQREAPARDAHGPPAGGLVNVVADALWVPDLRAPVKTLARDFR